MRSSADPPPRILNPRDNSALLAYIDAAFDAGECAALVAFQVEDAHFDFFVVGWGTAFVAGPPIFYNWLGLADKEAFAVADVDAFEALEFCVRGFD